MYSVKVSDEEFRKNYIKKIIKNKSICDFGSGYGSNLMILEELGKKVDAVEISKIGIKSIKKNFPTVDVRESISDFSYRFDVVTMFHVFGHLPDPFNQLKKISEKIKRNGSIIIETLHANDFLSINLKHHAYNKFRFSKEYLVFHTSKSIEIFLKRLNFKNIKIEYFQRYGIDNHIGWIMHDMPSGHTKYNKVFSKKIDLEYKNNLIKKKITDTILVTATKI